MRVRNSSSTSLHETGASGAAVAWRLASAGIGVVCLEQGDWVNSGDVPGSKPEFELLIRTQWAWDANVRHRREDYPPELASYINRYHRGRLVVESPLAQLTSRIGGTVRTVAGNGSTCIRVCTSRHFPGTVASVSNSRNAFGSNLMDLIADQVVVVGDTPLDIACAKAVGNDADGVQVITLHEVSILP